MDEVFVRAAIVWTAVRHAQDAAQAVMCEACSISVGVVLLDKAAVESASTSNSWRTRSGVVEILRQPVFWIVFGKQPPKHVVSKRASLNALNCASKTPERIVTVISHKATFSYLLAARATTRLRRNLTNRSQITRRAVFELRGFSSSRD